MSNSSQFVPMNAKPGRRAFITNNSESKQESTYGYEWVSCCNYHIPPNAVKCGNDLDGSDMYVGLAYHAGEELPCKIVPRRRDAYVSHNGREHKVNDFRILIQKTMCWLPERDGQVPPGAIPAGRSRTGETLYVGRTQMDNATVVGKVHPSHSCLYVPYGGREVAHKQYEVLVFH